MSRRFFSYIRKVYGFLIEVENLCDHRNEPQVSTKSCFMFVFFLFALGVRSLNGFEERLRQDGRKRLWGVVFGSRSPSADTVGYCLERFDINGLRNLLHRLYTTLQRNHVIARLLTTMGLRALAIDGHELFSSYKRHCPFCSERTVHFKECDRIQYYHQVVVAQLVGGSLALPIDVEPVLPGENETGASRRLLERVLKKYPKAFDIVTGDSLYANPEILLLLRSHNKHLLSVLKENHPDLLKDARALLALEKPVLSKDKNTKLERWDMEGFNTWTQVDMNMRVIRSREKRTQKEKITTSDWFWVTTIEKLQASTELICKFGHARWDIENQGFNYLTNYININHCFHHQQNAILAFILIAFIAYILIQTFHQLNLKPQKRTKLSLFGIIQELSISFWLDLPKMNPEPRAPPIP